ncbi:MAG: hypothetical protein WDN24_05035 [Sphingomonas sp.]
MVTGRTEPSSGVVVMLDDRPFTIQDHVSIIEHYGLAPRVFTGPVSLANYIHDNGGADIRAFVVDLHIPGASSGLSALGLNASAVTNDYDIGLAVAETLLAGRFEAVPVIFLTAMGIHAEVAAKIQDVMHRRKNVQFFDKASDPRDFESVVRSISIQPDLPVDFGFGAIVRPERVVRDGAIIKIIEPIYSELVRALNRDPSLFRNLTPRQWEEVIAGTYVRAGFDDVILTPSVPGTWGAMSSRSSGDSVR